MASTSAHPTQIYWLGPLVYCLSPDSSVLNGDRREVITEQSTVTSTSLSQSSSDRATQAVQLFYFHSTQTYRRDLLLQDHEPRTEYWTYLFLKVSPTFSHSTLFSKMLHLYVILAKLFLVFILIHSSSIHSFCMGLPK